MTALPAFAVEKTDVLTTYADIAAAKYADSLTTAQMLQLAVASLIAAPSAKAMAAARAAYLAARGPICKPRSTALATRWSMIGKAG